MAATEDTSSRVTVLVGDSQTLFAQTLAAALARRPGFEVFDTHPRSGVEAAQATVHLRPDVALLDFWLEAITAPAATQSIMAKAPETRVVVMGWFHGPDQIRQAFDAGAAGFVAKDVPLETLATVLRRVAGGECVLADRQFAPAAGSADSADSADSSEAADASEPADYGATDAQPVEPVEAEPSLTVRELEVLRLLGAGLPVEDVASRLGIKRETARTHLARVLAKTDARSQLEAVAVARQRGYFA